MPSQLTVIWAGATGTAVAVAGAAAIYLAHPGFIWPSAAPVAVAARVPDTPAPVPAAPSKPSVATPAAPPAPEKPSFDVVSIEPTGEAVVAGRAAPNARVELKDAGRTVAEATASSEGQFVIIPPTLAPGEHSLALSTGAGSLAQTSNAVSVAVAAPESGPKAAPASSTPAPPSPASASAPSTAPALPRASSPAGRIAVESVEASLGGRLVAKGAAAPNATVRLYLSGVYVGDAKTTADGRWSLTIAHGMTPGAYEMRADEINPADAKVAARAEAPFNYPSTPAAAAPTKVAASVSAASPNPALPAASSPDLVVDSIQTHHVEAGHTLWGISQKFYGDGSRYQAIFAANSGQIRDPHWIYPGQVFVVPKAEAKP